jgi:5-methylcytosine-specific restriction endonuclease McrA
MPQATGENNSRWNRIDKECVVCGALFTVKGYRKETARCCSFECSWKDPIRLEKVAGALRGRHFDNPGLYKKGHTQPAEARAKMSATKLGKCNPPVFIICQSCGTEKQVRSMHQVKKQKYCSRACGDKGRVRPPMLVTCQRCGQQKKVTSKGQAKSQRFCSRECFNAERDRGLTTEAERIRRSVPGKRWRVAVFERDDYTCQMCGQRGGILNADHIKPFALHPKLRFDVNNGRTLCVPCHRATDTYGRRPIYRVAVA